MFGSEFYIGFGIGMLISAELLHGILLAMSLDKLQRDGGIVQTMADDIIKNLLLNY